MKHCANCRTRLWPWSEKFFDRSPPRDFFCSHFCLEQFREKQRHAQTFADMFPRNLFNKKEGNQDAH